MVYIDSTITLKMFLSKITSKTTSKVERLSGLSYIILAKFEVRFMGDFELIQMKPTLCKGRVSAAWKFKCLKFSLQFNLWTSQIFVVITHHKIREIKVQIKETTTLLYQAPQLQGVTHYENEYICTIINVVVGRRRRGDTARPLYQR